MKGPFDELQETLSKFKVVDLAHTIEKGIPKWPTHPQIIIDHSCSYEHDGYFNQCLIMGEHTGSHVDAPAHTVPEKSECTVDTLPVDAICGQAVMYNLYELGPMPGERIPASAILKLEDKMKDSAKEGEIAILNFGWEQFWRTDRDWKFYATNEPGLGEDAVKLFADRKVRAVGCDTIACDTPVKDGYEMLSYGHYRHWLPNGILIIEELRNLKELPVRFYFVAAPLKIKNGSGSPIRPFALVPKSC